MRGPLCLRVLPDLGEVTRYSHKHSVNAESARRSLIRKNLIAELQNNHTVTELREVLVFLLKEHFI